MSSTGDWNAAQKSALDWLGQRRPALSRDDMALWDFHEPSWREYRSSQWYVDRLRQEGFEVELGSAGMPTAFCARWRNGNGPTIAGAGALSQAARRRQQICRRPHRSAFRARHGFVLRFCRGAARDGATW